MNFFSLIINSFRHFLKGNITIAAGVAVTAAVITGALMVGDSVQYSLLKSTNYRLGNITHSITAQDRLFTQSLAERIASETGLPVSSALYTSASGLIGGGEHALENIQLWGIDEHFSKTVGIDSLYDSLAENEIIISQNTADRLMLQKGDWLLLRIRKLDVIPPNTPFVAEDQVLSKRYKVKAIAGARHLGRLNMRQSQTAPFNAFVDYEKLSQEMGIPKKTNIVLIAADSYSDSNPITTALENAWSAEDTGLKFRKIPKLNQTEIISERVFIDSLSAELIENAVPNKQNILTYFVNEIRLDDKFTPYSFVSGYDSEDLSAGEIIINRWTADDLNAQTGDTLWLSYFVVGPMRALDTDSMQFVVKDIVPIEGFYADRNLMPKIPGFSDAGSCGDWSAGVPIDLDKIRDKDETYWKRYRGTPKAFISFEQAETLWANRFGRLTAYRFSDDSLSEEMLRTKISDAVKPKQYGVTLNQVKKDGIQAARGGVDFAQLFLALSFFIIVSGVLLTVLLFKFHIEQRTTQIGTFSAMGFSRKLIVRIILGEQAFTALIGSVAGIVLAIFYNGLVFKALNSMWHDIVRTDVLETKVYFSTILTGFALSFLIALLSQYFVTKKILKQESANLQKRTFLYKNKFWISAQRLFLWLLPTGIISLVVSQLFGSQSQNPALFFAVGGMFLVFIILLSVYALERIEKRSYKRLSFSGLSAKNTVRNPLRSLMIILLLSIGSFLVMSTGMNKADLFADAENRQAGTGGFLYYAESTVPILKNLNAPDIRREFSLQKAAEIVQFRVSDGEDAGCLNLNRVSNPRILSVQPELLSGRFSFVSKTPYLNPDAPWLSINEEYDNFIPAIADQTVIQWGLGKKVGDTLSYIDAFGNDINLKLIGGLEASVFQGNVIISDKHFLKHFPYTDGSSVFLIEGKFADSTAIKNEIELAFDNHGIVLEKTAERLAEFKSIENTYLTIFMAMGAIGLLIGIIGLAVAAARSIRERLSESALLRAIGYSNRRIFLLYIREYAALMLVGLLAGTTAAAISVLPSLLSPNTDNSLFFVISVVLISIINGLFWVGLSIGLQLKRINLRQVLCDDI